MENKCDHMTSEKYAKRQSLHSSKACPGLSFSDDCGIVARSEMPGRVPCLLLCVPCCTPMHVACHRELFLGVSIVRSSTQAPAGRSTFLP